MKENRLLRSRIPLVYTILLIFGVFYADAEENILPDVPVQQDVVFPEEQKGFYFVEGESAVSTNFNSEPTLNFGSSGSRTLQLGRFTSLPGGIPFSAEYLLYLEEGGSFELWYGGTPPGPRDDFAPSYSSPFSLYVDNREEFAVYREDVKVVEQYLPGYYWSRVGEIDLSEGIHTIRFEVSEKRRYDGKYLFYLDNFFLVRKDVKADLSREDIPRVFPSRITGPYPDIMFRSIVEYENDLKDNPDPDLAVELSLVYSLTGEYTNALRTLRKARLLQPDNPYLHILAGKNRIWKGETAEGLKEYRKALDLQPQAMEVWLEAGKLAAWTGKYERSISFFTEGLKQFPESLELHVHLALSFLWASRNSEAEDYFEQAEALARGDAALVKQLANILIIAGYPERAIEVYKRALPRFPRDLEMYLLLCKTYTRMEMDDEAAAVLQKVEEVLPPSERLSRSLRLFRIRLTMRDDLIARYEEDLRAEPDNLNVRHQLVQTYFWNGLRQKAIGEYLNIITNHAYQALTDLDAESIGLLETLDRLYVLTGFFRDFRDGGRDMKKELSDAVSAYRSAEKEYNGLLEKISAAREKGEAPPDLPVEEALEKLDGAEKTLADMVARNQVYLDIFSEREKQLEGELGRIPGIVEAEKEEAARFDQITKSLNWRWDRSGLIREEEALAAKGNTLAAYVLGRVYQIDKRFKDAAPFLESAQADLDMLPVEYAWLQNLLWAGTLAPESPGVVSAYARVRKYAPYMGAMEQLITSGEGTAEFTLFTGETVSQAEQLVSDITALDKPVITAIRNGERNLAVIHAVLENRLERKMYTFEEGTYLIRFELGNYYLAEGDLPNATEQYRKVLSVDPWNTSALYQLGVVRQRYGDWKEAMQYYKRVYEIDPGFENAALYSNQLARQHADSLKFSAYTLADTSRLAYHGEASVRAGLTSFLGIDVALAVDSIKNYKVFGEEQQSSYLVQSLTTGLPVSLFSNRLVLSPGAGLSLFSRIYDNTFLLEGDRLLSLPEFFGEYEIAPLLGFSVTASFDPVYASGTYRFGRYEETYNPERDIVNAHNGEASIQVSLGNIKVPVLRTLTLRTYGRTRFLHTLKSGDRNFIGTVSQDITSNIHLADSPWTTLILGGNLVFEHSKKEEPVNYYTPIGVLVTKGNAGVSSWISLGKGNVLGVNLQSGAGVYIEHLGYEDMERSLQLEGSTRIDFQRSNSSFYLSMNGSATFSDFPETRYWSLFATIGYTTSLPKLLAE